MGDGMSATEILYGQAVVPALRDSRLFRFAPVSEEMILNYIANHDLQMPRAY
jgi:hypothetical protein